MSCIVAYIHHNLTFFGDANKTKKTKVRLQDLIDNVILRATVNYCSLKLQAFKLHADSVQWNGNITTFCLILYD